MGDSSTKTVGLRIDNQTGRDTDVDVVISRENTTVDEKTISVSDGETKTVETSISNPGVYTVEVATDDRTGEFTLPVEQRTIDDELKIIIKMGSEKIRSYIQE